jgi:hypothetical protein
MDVFDKFFIKFAYKFPKGYPDMGDPNDVLLLESIILKELGIKINLREDKASDRNEAKTILKKELGLSDSDFKDDGLNFYILVPGNQRLEYVDKIEKINTGTNKNFEFTSTPSSFSSLGYFMYGQSKFGIKPGEKQGGKSAGLDNEEIFVNSIESFLEDGPKNVKIISDGKEVIFKNVTQVIGTGRSTSDYKKSDANFYDGEKDLGGVSLKKDNAIYWESADVRFKNEVKNLVDAIVSGKLGDEVSYIPLEDTKGNPDPDIIKMYNKKENKPIAGVIVNDLPAQETNEIIFGNDKVPVVVRTFRPSDFTLDGDTVIVNATKIYETIEDIKADNAQPVLNIRHDKTRRATRGLRALLQTAKSLYTDGSLKGNNITIPYNSFN